MPEIAEAIWLRQQWLCGATGQTTKQGENATTASFVPLTGGKRHPLYCHFNQQVANALF